MTKPPNEKGYPNTYFVQDRSHQDEMYRLHIQGQLITESMGGPLPEQPSPPHFQRVLDVGCGTGEWLITLAKAFPDIEQLIGVDASSVIIEYARSQAKAEGIEGRVEFAVMDALSFLEFPDNYFDLANERFATSFVRSWEWTKLFSEFQRVTKPGGIVRICELTDIFDYSSPALSRLAALFLDALSQSGHGFISNRYGKIEELVPLLQRHGFLNIQQKKYSLVFRAGTPQGQSFYQDQQKLFRAIEPFMRKWLRLPEDYEKIYQQALEEMQQPDFVATWPVFTTWGTVPSKPPSKAYRD